jgi:lactate 2-monooxygenase
MTKFSGLDRQREIYTLGISGAKSKIPFDAQALEQKAQKNMSKAAFAYIAGGAGLQNSVKNNRNDFSNWRIIPKMLQDVSIRDTSVELFGQKLPVPLLLSPIGVLEIVDKKADLAVAKAASNLNIPMIFSNQASFPMEETAKVMGDSSRWFQLYWSKSNELVESLVSRAEKAGCSAIVVTLDTTLLGWRTEDLDLAYLPFLRGKGIAQYVSDPVFQRLLDEPEKETDTPLKPKMNLKTVKFIYELMSNYPGNFFNNLKTQRPMKAVKKFINIYSRPSLTWDDLAFLRKITKLPILLKGILHEADAQKALDFGIDGLIVSNHGGRQVDGSISSIMALPKIAKVINQQIPILMDSGIRGGADIFKAINLGATAVCIGRPYVYGLAIDGQKGVEDIIKNYWADFEFTMALAGCKNIEEVRNSDVLMC